MESNVAQLPLSDRLWAWFETNKKQTLYGAVIVLLVGIIAGFFVWRHGEKEAAAGQALAVLTAKQMTGGAPPSTADYLKVASAYPSSGAATRALLLAAGNLFTEGKYSEAQVQFEKFTREHRDSPLMSQALLGIAACLDAQGKTNEAVAAYKNLVDRHSGEGLVFQAKFSLASIYEAQNKLEQAHALFEEVARTDPYGSIGSEAGMRAEELKAKLPSPAPTAPAVAPKPAPILAPAPASPPVKTEKK